MFQFSLVQCSAVASSAVRRVCKPLILITAIAMKWRRRGSQDRMGIGHVVKSSTSHVGRGSVWVRVTRAWYLRIWWAYHREVQTPLTWFAADLPYRLQSNVNMRKFHSKSTENRRSKANLKHIDMSRFFRFHGYSILYGESHQSDLLYRLNPSWGLHLSTV